HYTDWMDQRVDESKDYQLAAKITAARKEVADEPNNYQLKVNLANLYLQGGLFDEAVNSTEEAISQAGEKPSLLGLLAKAMYYRDGRKLGEDALHAIDKALKQDNFEVTSRMLLAEDAFRRGEYHKAIEEWQLLLDSNVAPENAKAFSNAIANAKNRLAQKETN
ncbi:MAG: tetratricopeptide repeat protein, partial [Burkholderiales bacterium]|nr:tetratricopeptide repeat protein [Burkholderiales bacterium]